MCNCSELIGRRVSKAQPKKPGEDGNAAPTLRRWREISRAKLAFRPSLVAGEAIRSFRECRDCKASENVTLALRFWVVKVLNWSDLSNAEFSVFLVSNAEFSKVCVPEKSPQTGVKFEPPKKTPKLKADSRGEVHFSLLSSGTPSAEICCV